MQTCRGKGAENGGGPEAILAAQAIGKEKRVRVSWRAK
jgi:hypothetical protein